MLGFINLFKRQHDKAIKEGERAIELNPNGAFALAGLGFILSYSGKPDKAIQLVKHALRLDPIPLPYVYNFLIIAYRTNGQYKKAIECAEKTLRVNPDQLTPNLTLAATYSSLNRIEETKKAVEEVLRIDPNFSLDYLAKTLPLKRQEDLEIFIGALRKAGLPE